MKTFDMSINKAAEIIAPLWPLRTMIAKNPLQSIESLDFEDAIMAGEVFLAGNSNLSEGSASGVNREMIKWCQVFLDEGQAAIAMPERQKGFYRSWALLAPFDRRLRSAKKNGWLASLPSEPEAAISLCLKKMNISEAQIEEYFRYSFAELPGWASYIKWRANWQNKSAGLKNPITLADFLAVRLVIACAMNEDWQTVKLKTDRSHSKPLDKEFFSHLKSQEEKYLQRLLKLVFAEAIKLNMRKNNHLRPDAQIVFCIDVRSEPFRKRIEREGNYETFGFAGFFGLPVSIRKYNQDQVNDCCPVLIKPSYEVYEEPICEEKERICRHQKGKNFFNMCRRFYQDLKYNFATPFALVETLGLWCGLWMAIRTLMPASSVKLREAIRQKIKPNIATFPKLDIPPATQAVIAESALRIMGLTNNFSRLVVFCGHGSRTENNPYASALDCGACGGNPGGPNGKILAAILNSSEVRTVLKQKGIEIPQDTLFVGAEHNTTTDEVVLDDQSTASILHKTLISKLKADFIKAGIANSQQRCKTLGADASIHHAKKHVLRRSSDWSETRPEWGLARNAAFIAGPRSLTKNLDLEGRCFLHSYLWEEDEQGKYLEAILTAPMVVAEWINTQYFFSTLNNIAYGSGSKITHNVTGKFGIMQGNSSDLMQGLPLQSVNVNDDDHYHEAIRLQVIVYAPRSRIETIIKKHSILQTLFFNRWVFLVAIDPLDHKPYRLKRTGEWAEISIFETSLNFSPMMNSLQSSAAQKTTKKYRYQDRECAMAAMKDKEK